MNFYSGFRLPVHTINFVGMFTCRVIGGYMFCSVVFDEAGKLKKFFFKFLVAFFCFFVFFCLFVCFPITCHYVIYPLIPRTLYQLACKW